MDFGDAIRAMKSGKLVTRRGWNGKGMFIFLGHARVSMSEENGDVVSPTLCMFTAQKTVVIGWLASQTDMLAEDWEVLP